MTATRKKKLYTNQTVSGDVYRMFKISGEDIREVKAAMRWARKNCISTFCIAEHSSSIESFGRHRRGGQPTLGSLRAVLGGESNKHRVIMGFSDDSDAMAIRMTLDNVEELTMWPQKQRFSVYEIEYG